MRMLRMMEEWGSGYQRINDACRTGGYPEPEWQELGAAVRVVFRPHPELVRMNEPVNEPDVPVNVPVNDRQKWLLEQIAAKRNPKADDIAEHFNVTTMTAKRDIADLKDRGVIEFVGSPKTGWYWRK